VITNAGRAFMKTRRIKSDVRTYPKLCGLQVLLKRQNYFKLQRYFLISILYLHSDVILQGVFEYYKTQRY